MRRLFLLKKTEKHVATPVNSITKDYTGLSTLFRTGINYKIVSKYLYMSILKFIFLCPEKGFANNIKQNSI